MEGTCVVIDENTESNTHTSLVVFLESIWHGIVWQGIALVLLRIRAVCEER